MKKITEVQYSGERAEYGVNNCQYEYCIFDNGESPLKESKCLDLSNCMFKWKYPFWYCDDVKVDNCTWFEMARAGVWYTNNMTVSNSVIQAPKNFRRCNNLTLNNVTFTRAAETLWNCDNVKLNNVTAKGDYFAMGTGDIEVDSLMLDGNYSFDGCKNVTIKNSKLLSKDAFWNCENVTVYDSYICGEYLGWNSKKVTLINCTIESLQGMCYIGELVMKNCRLLNTTLAFEYSNVDAEIVSGIESVFNPKSGTIKAESIKELIVEKDKVDPAKTKIICNNIEKESEHPEWIK